MTPRPRQNRAVLLLGWAVGSAGPGCSLDSAGVFGAGDNDLPTATDTDTDAGTGDATTQAGTDGTAADSANADTGDPSSGTTDTSQDSTTGPAPGGALLQLDVTPIVFPMVEAQTSITTSVTVTNIGDGPATDMLSMGLGGAFSLSGGAWPGNAGDCGTELAGGSSCTVELSFTPPVMGPYDAVWVVAYGDGMGPATLQTDVTGQAQQVTANLVQNPDAELGGAPPTHWTEVDGSNWNTTASQARSPTSSINPGEAFGLTPQWLRQDVDVSSFDAAIDTGNTHIDFSGWVLTAGTHTYSLRLQFLGQGGALVDEHTWDFQTQTSWGERAMSSNLPIGTRRIRVLLGGQHVSGIYEAIAVFFDDFSLTLSYP